MCCLEGALERECGLRTSSSPLSQAAGRLSRFPFVALCHFVHVWLLPGHLLHESLETTNTKRDLADPRCKQAEIHAESNESLPAHLVLRDQRFELRDVLRKRLGVSLDQCGLGPL